MKSDCLKELRASIIDAIKNGNVEQEYPKWIYECRVHYGISSYTLQLLITFYTKYLNEKDTLIPTNNVDCFIKYSGTEEKGKVPNPTNQTESKEITKKKPNIEGNNKKKFHLLWILAVIFPILLIFTLMANNKIVEKNKIDANEIPINKIGESLNSPSITLDSITAIEKRIKTQNIEQSKEMNSHFIALKHIYINEFMVKNHSVQSLKNAYAIRADEFSPAQQEIMNWYLEQDSNIQKLWEICENAVSFTDFKRKIQEKAKKYNLNRDNHE